MACRLPGARNYDEFWTNLQNGRGFIREIPADRWDVTEYDPQDPDAARLRDARWGGLLDRVDLFDNRFFGISAREARGMDPQQRLLLEESWHCLEDAAVVPEKLRARVTSVYVGVMTIDYHQNVTSPGVPTDSYACLGNYVGLLANRLSHFHGWRGESYTLDAACAGSLTALHQARRALQAGECDYALVAGVSLIINPWHYVSFARSRMLSPTGQCRTFDRDANGYVPGEGVSVLLLCREEDARRDGARVHGRVIGSATGHVGASASITAPSVAAQRRVIQDAARSAGINLSTVSYVEAHGTGTPLGDPIEVAALTQALSEGEPREAPCWIGSVKTGIGHLEAAAGLAGVTKVLLMMRHRSVPPTLNLSHVNPLIDFATGPLRPATTLAPWEGRGLRAGVSGFGFGGTNAHVILEAPEPRHALPSHDEATLPFVLSAASADSFRMLWDDWRHFVAGPAFEAMALRDILGTLACGRTHLPYRFAAVVADRAALRRLFDRPAPAPAYAPAPPKISLRTGDARTGDARTGDARAGNDRAGNDRAGNDRAGNDRAAVDRIALLQRLGIRPVAVVGIDVGDASIARYDPAARRMHLPVALDGMYLRALRDDLRLADLTAIGPLVGRSRDLVISNYTFRGYLDDWQRAIGGTGDVFAWIDQPPADTAARRLLVLGLLSAIRRLVRRWDLADPHDAPSEAWHEIAGLIADGLLREQEAIALLDAAPAAIARLASAVAERALLQGFPADAAILQRHSADRQGVVEMDAPPTDRTEDSRALGRIDGLAELWQAGAAVDWTALDASHRIVSLPLYPFDGQRHWIERRTAGAEPAEPPPAVTLAIDDPVRPSRPIVPERDAEALLDRLDSYAAHRLFVALERAGALTPLGTGMPRDEIVRRCLRLPGRRPLLDACLEILGRHGLVTLVGEQVRSMTERAAAATVAEAERTALASADRGLSAVADAVDHCTAALPAVLAGEVPAEDVLFPARDPALAERLMEALPGAAACLDLTAARIAEAVEARLREAPGQPVRIIEVGAGTGAATARVLAALTPFADRVHYTCSDPSAAALTAARTRLAGAPITPDFVRLDLTAPLRTAVDTKFDIALAVNALQGAGPVGDAIRQLADRLRPGGVLVINEPLRARDVLTVTLGLLARWWDPDPVRTGPWLTTEDWRMALRDGFDAVSVTGGDSRGVLVARSAGAVAGDTVAADTAAAGAGQSWVAPAKDIPLAPEPSGVPSAATPPAAVAPVAPPEAVPLSGGDPAMLSVPALLTMVRDAIAQTVETDPAAIGDTTRFVDLGIDSLASGDLADALAQGLGRPVSMHLITDHPTPRALAQALADQGAGRPIPPPPHAEPAPAVEPSPAVASDPASRPAEPRRVPDPAPRPPTPAVTGIWQVATPGSLDSLHEREEVRRLPGLDEVEVEVDAAALNFRDVMEALGRLGSEPRPLGLEFAGRVVALGPDVAEFAPGDPVLGLRVGSLARHVVARADLLVPLPPTLTPAEAASLPIVFLTASWTLERLARLTAGQTVLIHAATGGVGLAALQIARLAGATVVATAGSPEKRALLRDMGLACVADSRDASFAETVRDATGGAGVDVVLNCLAGEMTDASLALVRPGGIFIEIGKTDIRPAAAMARDYPRIRYTVFDLLAEIDRDPALVGRHLAALLQRFGDAELTPVPVRTFPFDEAPTALRFLARARHIGKVVLTTAPIEASRSFAAPSVGPAFAVTERSPAPDSQPPGSASAPHHEAASEPIAIVGMAGRFPGAPDLGAFWRLLRDGTDAIGVVPPGRWDPRECDALGVSATGDAPHRAGGFLEDAECFDAAFFGISPREALLMDPQQRVMLEQAWLALADAGARPGEATAERTDLFKRTGVFIGASASDYTQKAALLGLPVDRPSLLAQMPSSLSARLAYLFDLKGPALTVDMGCASAIAAIKLAVDALRRNEVEIAVAGAVAVQSTPHLAAMAGQAEILAPDGRCRSFAADAAGLGLSEGVGVVVLRRLSDALARGDTVHAVIRAAAVSQNGATNGIGAPSVTAQTTLARETFAAARLAPAAVSYVEAHGVGTQAGDAAEVAALAEVFGTDRPLTIGSVKSNIGHALAASGMAGLLKLVLQLRHGQLAPSLHAEANPLRALSQTGLAINARLAPWPSVGPRLAALNAFAINGSNGFLLLEEAPAAASTPSALAPAGALLLLADRTEAGLRARLSELADRLDGPPVALADLAATLNAVPADLPWCAAFVASDTATFRGQLRGAVAGSDAQGWCMGEVRRLDPLTRPVFADMAARLCQEAVGADAATGRTRLLAAARLFVDGIDVVVPVPAGARRVNLIPPYRFDRKRFWPDGNGSAAPAAPAGSVPEDADPRPAILRDAAAAILRLPADTIRDQSALPRLGLDSLLAFELRTRLTALLGTAPEPASLLADRPLSELARTLAMPTGTSVPPVVAADITGRFDPFPLTDIQLAYWLGRTSGFALGGACHVYWEFLGTPDRDPDRLQAVLNRLIALHDMLRAVVLPDGTQRVLPDVPPYMIERHDWEGDAHADRHLADLRAAMTRETFDPTRWPLFRVAFSRDGAHTRVHLGIDLLIIDVPSLAILLGQWGRLYDDPATVVQPPGITFRDYVLHQRWEETSPATQSALAYWTSVAPTLPPAPVLPDMKPLDARADWLWTRHRDVLDPGTWTRLKARAQAAGVTPVAALVSAFAEVLGHWTIEPRFTLNLTVNDRQPIHPDISAVIGDFTSTVLLGLDLGDRVKFVDRARGTGTDLASHLGHARYTGVRVLQQRGNGRGDLMPVVFTSMLGYGALSGPLGRLDHGATRTPQVWLDAQVMEVDGALVITWDAIDALFPDGLMGGMFAAWGAALRLLALDADAWNRPLAAWLDAAERDRRVRRNATDFVVTEGVLHEPFLRQARTNPDRIAVIGPDGTVTYGELLGHARAVAGMLGAVEADRLVAVSMPKGWRQVAAVIGVLLAGGAYLPIDPALPAARRHHLVARGETATVLTLDSLGLNWPDGTQVVALDTIPPLPQPAVLPPPRAKPHDLAYVIFTSGSTGEPKGVMIEHRAALNTVLDVNDTYRVGPDDRVLGLSSLGFDLSVYDIFGLLGAGGAIVLPDPRSAADPAHLADLIRAHRVTIWNSVPMFVQLFLEGAEADAALARMRLVMMSGDWIPVGLPPRLQQSNPALEVISLGGATEASIWSIAYRIGAPDPAWSSIPYGFPMRNQRFHVLDERMGDRRDWIAGELFIAGVGLARGYWRDPAITASRFVTHPVTGERLYRTGDLGRYRDDGVIEFLGRNDGQVKVGGYRIELGEIEATLVRHPGVRHAAVVVRTDADGHRSLAAFYVADAARPPDTTTLRAHVSETLPGYMVPALFQRLDAMPLNANEKVDRKALANWQPLPVLPAVPVAVPSRDLEGPILEIWRDVLRNPLLPADGKLFEHGAHSFHAVDANARINRALAVGCTVTDIFEFSTVRALAAALAERRAPPALRPASEAAPVMTPVATPAATPMAAPVTPALSRIQRRRQFRAGRLA